MRTAVRSLNLPLSYLLFLIAFFILNREVNAQRRAINIVDFDQLEFVISNGQQESAVQDQKRRKLPLISIKFLRQHCYACHNEDERESGIRVDQLDGSVPENRIKLWEEIAEQIESEEMPPEDQPQPTSAEREEMLEWIETALNQARSRKQPVNGAVRRLTVEQYRNTLAELLSLEEDFAAVLPPDGVSRHGFTNDVSTLLTSPLQVEAWIEIAEKAIDAALVDETVPPAIQHFRMELGRAINPEPFGESLILGANSHLLANQDFVITEPYLAKPFEFDPLRMRTNYRFNEGYQGNGTVRGWREYTSIYHSVFACMRGDRGYPKGDAYQTVPEGLLLRPAIPTNEIFGESSTYGPKANFKIALRELPEFGRFRVTVNAAKYDDGLLLTGRGFKPMPLAISSVSKEGADAAGSDPLGDQDSNSTQNALGQIDQIQLTATDAEQSFKIQETGIYQIDIHPKSNADKIDAEPNEANLNDGLIGHWTFDGDQPSRSQAGDFEGDLRGGLSLVDSPVIPLLIDPADPSAIEKDAEPPKHQALNLDGTDDSLATPRSETMAVGEGSFTVSAWIRPTQLRQGGIVCLGKYSWTHGWYFDMPNNQGVLRIETASPQNQSNGTVASRPGVIRANQWQHVAAVVQRGENQTHLYVNGYRVATGTINAANLDNPNVDLHIGRIQDSKLFKGQIDELRIYRRALEEPELAALLRSGEDLLSPPPTRGPEQIRLSVGKREFGSKLGQNESAFLALRLKQGEQTLKITDRQSLESIGKVVLTRLPEDSQVYQDFQTFDQRNPSLGVYMGLRRDCGHTCQQVNSPLRISKTELHDYQFEGAINNYPRPFVQPENDNYLAGVREITVRSEYTDGRDMPRMLIRSVEFEGPYYEQWPPKSHKRIFIQSEHADQPEIYAREILGSFATRAFRRPVNEKELREFVGSWKTFHQASDDFQKSIKQALVVVLTSPSFLFAIERSESPEAEPLTEMELASKLSYFLWNGPPDDPLISAANTGQLREEMTQQVDRLIEDSKFTEFCDRFVDQWLSLDKFDVVETDRKKYRQLSPNAKRQLASEPAKFFEYLMRENLPVSYLIESPIAVMNETVANYYGLADRVESGLEFVAVEHGEPHLGGILTQAALLAGLSDGREANPVKRGAWFARKLIAEPPDDPPPNVPELKDDRNLSLRERLEQHRSVKGCAKCHEGIDPWGLPFESFNAGGLFSGDQVDSSTSLPDGTEIRDFTEFRAYLIEKRMPSVTFSVMKHLSIYAIGRSLTYNEEQALRERIEEIDCKAYRMQDLLRDVIQSDLFLTK